MTQTRNPQTPAVLDRLRDEMAAHPEDSMLLTVGELLTAYAGDHPAAIPALAAEGKTIQGAIDAMRDAASKRRNGASCVALSMVDGMKIVFAYFGLPHDPRGILRAALLLAEEMPEAVVPTPMRSKATAGLDLDTLLGL